MTKRALTTMGGKVTFDVAGAGRLTVSLDGNQLGEGTVTGNLDGAPLGPSPLEGDTPVSSYSLGKHELPDGGLLVWGVVPQQTLSVNPQLTPSASAGPAGMRPLGEHAAFLAYAVIVKGRPADVTGFRTTDRSGTGIGYVE